MPSLIDMRRRIRAVKSTQQITKAMKMVAASKLRRAQERIIATRPFAREARRVLTSIAARVDQTKHPLLVRRPGAEKGPVTLVVIAGDRGLAGSFNSNVIKAVGLFLRDHPGREISLALIGRKSRDMLGRRGLRVLFDYVNLPKIIQFPEAEAIASPVVKEYLEGKVDSVYLVYNEFKSVIAQRVVVEPLLPFAPIAEANAPAPGEATSEYIYEPSPERIFDVLLSRLVEAQVLRALLESNAAFYAAQMTAMDAATRNSADMIEDLTLTMNKVRQAAITREIIEVVSGAQAL
jgi:F-type H+-transporting ATPase subunit gamma